MGWRFLRNLLFSGLVLAVITLLVRLDLPYTKSITDYIYYVLTTDFDPQVILQTIGSGW
ncbi:MAG: hypothetical protein GX020_06845 [Firmicutes bacterium]|nr:hypothetical protein [Bacillota bacterium]